MTVATSDGESIWAFRYSSEKSHELALLLDRRRPGAAAVSGAGGPRPSWEPTPASIVSEPLRRPPRRMERGPGGLVGGRAAGRGRDPALPASWLPEPDDERVGPAHARRRADAAGTRGAVRDRRHPVGRRPSPVSSGGVPAGGDLGGRPVRRRRLRRRTARGDTRREQRSDRVAAVRRPRRPHGAAVRPLRRAAPAGRGRLAHAAVPPHRGGRPLVRPRCSRLQGQPPHAPHRPARARRRRSGQPQTGRRGIRGAGHRRARGVRPRARRSPARRRHRRRRHRQRRRRPPRGHRRACAATSTSS